MADFSSYQSESYLYNSEYENTIVPDSLDPFDYETQVPETSFSPEFEKKKRKFSPLVNIEPCLHDSLDENTIVLDSLDPFDYEVTMDSQSKIPPTNESNSEIESNNETESSSAHCYTGETVTPDFERFDPVVSCVNYDRAIVLDSLDPFDFNFLTDSQLPESPPADSQLLGFDSYNETTPLYWR